jgi:hypothetical protein
MGAFNIAQTGMNAFAGLYESHAMPSRPNTPDLSGNVKQGNAISNTATDQASQTFNTAKAYNQNAQDNLTKITGSQVPVMGELADTTNSNLQTYGSTFTPLQKQQADQAQAYGSEENIKRRQGMAVADQAASAEAARKRSAAMLASEGVDPASLHGGALDQQAALENAKNMAGASTASGLQTEDTARQMVSGANQLGLQVGALGNQGAQTGAGVASGLAGDVNSTNATGIQNMTANDSLLNTGVSANKSASDIANDAYQNEMQNYAAQVAQVKDKANNMRGMMSLDSGGPVPGGTAGIVQGVYAARGGSVSTRGALPMPPDPEHPTDTVPAMLTPHEYVIPKDVALHKGHEFFHKLVDKARIDMRDRQAIPHAPSVGA